MVNLQLLLNLYTRHILKKGIRQTNKSHLFFCFFTTTYLENQNVLYTARIHLLHNTNNIPYMKQIYTNLIQTFQLYWTKAPHLHFPQYISKAETNLSYKTQITLSRSRSGYNFNLQAYKITNTRFGLTHSSNCLRCSNGPKSI